MKLSLLLLFSILLISFVYSSISFNNNNENLYNSLDVNNDFIEYIEVPSSTPIASTTSSTTTTTTSSASTSTSESSETSSGSYDSSSSESSESSSSDSPPPASSSSDAPNNALLASAWVYYTGGKPLCSKKQCSGTGYYYSENFACGGSTGSNEDRGNWNNGSNHFIDPLPRNIEPSRIILNRIDMVLSGSFNCDNVQPASTLIFTSIQYYSLKWNITSNVDCFCGSCFMNYTLTTNLTGPLQSTISNYNFGGQNSFTISVVESGICLAYVQIKFYYDILPPSTTSGGNHSSGNGHNGNNNDNSRGTIKKWLIISGSITGGLILLVLFIIFIRKQSNKNQYKLLKDGKQIDISEIKLGERIGKGNFGEVFVGFWRGSKIAVKKLPAHNINENVQKEIQREIELMKNLRHPNIIQYLGSTASDIEICIFTEFMSRGSMYSILHNRKIDLQWSLMISMCMDAARGIIYLHNSTPIILHRDLKSHNLLVDTDYRVKVADFGLSTIEQSATMTACGTPCWSAPEVLRSQRYTERADVYSFGIVLWECATRMDPYSGLPPFQVIFAVGKEGLRPPVPKSAPPEFIKLIQDCWSENPQSRPTMEQVLTRLEAIDTTGWGEINFPETQNNNNNQQQNRIKNIV